jgi:heme-degrading monooxygenase HmoA
MVTVGMNYRVLPGKEQVFEKAFEQVLTALHASAGHSHSFLFKEVGNLNHYLILSEWNDQAAFDAFVKSEAFAKVTNWGKEQILSGRPQHTVYTV